jgi:hypothetical protein
MLARLDRQCRFVERSTWDEELGETCMVLYEHWSQSLGK